MSEVAITDARNRLSSIVDQALKEPVHLTRRGRKVATVVDPEYLQRLMDAAEELADIKALDEALAEAEGLGEVPVPWEEAKRELGL